MADGIILPGVGERVSTDQVTRNAILEHIQLLKIALGAENTFQGFLEFGQKPMTSSLSVAISSDQTPVPMYIDLLPLPVGASTSAKQDTQITALQLIDDIVHSGDSALSKYAVIGAVLDDTGTGTVTENQANALRMSSRRALLVEGVASGTAIPISAASLPLPTGAATSANQATAIISLQLIDDAIGRTGDSSSKMMVVGGQLDDVGTTTPSEGQLGMFRITAARGLHTNLRFTSGAEAGILATPLRVDPTGTTTQPVSASSLPLPSGAATSANQSTEITSLQLIDDIVQAESAAFGGKGVVAVGVLDDTATVTLTEGQAGSFRLTALRALHSNLRNASGAEIGILSAPIRTDPTGTTTQPVNVLDGCTVDVNNILGLINLPMGAATSAHQLTTLTSLTTIATNQATQTTSLQLIDDVIKTDDAAFTPATDKVLMVGAEFDDTSPDSVNEGDAGAIRMSANRNLYVTIRDAAGNERGLNVDASGRITVLAIGNVGHDGVDSSNPVKVGARARTSHITAVANDDRSDAICNTKGFRGVTLYHENRNDTFTSTTNGTTIDCSFSPVKYYGLVVNQTGTVTVWDVRLEGSHDNVTFTQILQHTNVTGTGVPVFSADAIPRPYLYIRARCAGLTLGPGTNVISTIIATQ